LKEKISQNRLADQKWVGRKKKNPALVSKSDHHQGINQFAAAADSHLSLGPEQIN